MYTDPWVYLSAAALVLILPLPWLLAAFLAAVIHELCHAAAVVLLGGTVHRLRVGIGGARMEVRLPGRTGEMLAALAGPAGSLMLLLLCRRMPRLAVCGLVQGLFNLLPVCPLDGGRALHCILEGICPALAGSIQVWVERTVLFLLLGVSCYGAAALRIGPWPLISVLFLIIGRPGRKIPCKREKFRVQ